MAVFLKSVKESLEHLVFSFRDCERTSGVFLRMKECGGCYHFLLRMENNLESSLCVFKNAKESKGFLGFFFLRK